MGIIKKETAAATNSSLYAVLIFKEDPIIQLYLSPIAGAAMKPNGISNIVSSGKLLKVSVE